MLVERLEEEWLADFEERKSAVARLRFAVGCAWATRVIAHEYLEPKVAAATASGATVAASNYQGPDFSLVSRRTVAVLGIIGLHALLIYGFATGIVHKVIVKFTPPIIVVPTTPKVVDRPPPLPTDPALQKQIPIIPREADVPKFDEENNDAPRVVAPVEPTRASTGTAAVLPPPPVNRVEGGPGKGFPSSDDFYPMQEIRTRTVGVVLLNVCTDARGKLTSDPTLVQSSGSAGLDQGAVRLAKAGSGRYRPTTEGGRAVDSCYPLRVRFNLRD
jgi:TonB family protein